jgi:hypothetical protein
MSAVFDCVPRLWDLPGNGARVGTFVMTFVL